MGAPFSVGDSKFGKRDGKQDEMANQPVEFFNTFENDPILGGKDE